MSRTVVLLLSDDTLAAALLAAAVELAGLAPQFARAGESPRSALRRVRPALVLVDCDHESCSDEFIGPALMMQARVLLIRSNKTKRDVSDFAPRLGLRVVNMPADHHELELILHELLGQD